MYQVELDDAGRQELYRRAHQPDVTPRLRDRLEMIRLSDAGWTIPQIAPHLQTHHQTVRRWIKVFLLEGFDGLIDPPRPGQKSAITKEILDAVRSWLEKADRTWNASQIAREVQTQFGIKRTPKQWRFLLKRHGLAYKRTSRNLKHKQKPEQVQAKKDALDLLEKGGSPA